MFGGVNAVAGCGSGARVGEWTGVVVGTGGRRRAVAGTGARPTNTAPKSSAPGG